MALPRRFPIRFSGVNRAMVMLGIVPEHCRVELDEGEIRVRMGWAFRLDAPRSTIRSVARDDGRVCGWGAHGWRGTWLVNGSSSGLVRVVFGPSAHGRTAGNRVRVRVLRVSVEDPGGLVAALTPVTP